MKISAFIFLFFLSGISVLFAQEETVNNENFPSTPQMLLGCVSRDDFLQSPFVEWYQPGYDSYIVDTNELAKIFPDSLSGISVTVVFGSWCPDSRAEVPGFFKVCDFLKINPKNIKIIGVDKSKDVQADCAEDESVEYVPTYFFYYNGKLLKKIVDHSDTIFEQLFSSLY